MKHVEHLTKISYGFANTSMIRRLGAGTDDGDLQLQIETQLIRFCSPI